MVLRCFSGSIACLWDATSPAWEERRSAALVGLLAMAMCTLRQNYLVPVALFISFGFGARFAWPQNGQRLAVLRQSALVAAATVAFLLPWMVLSYRSSGTFLFPIMKGYFRSDYSLLQHRETAREQWRFFLQNVFYDSPVRPFGLFVLAGAVCVERRPGRPLPAFIAAVVLGGIALVHFFEQSDPPNLGRYFFALSVALVVATVLDVVARASQRGRDARAAWMPAALTLAATAVFLMDMKAPIASAYDQWIDRLGKLHDPPSVPGDETDPTYQALQKAVPRGETLVVMLDAPYKLDFRRNRVFNLDLPGAVSLPPSMPVADGPEAVAKYLLGSSIRYFAFLRDTTSFALYQRAHWQTLATSPTVMWAREATFYLAMFSDASALAKTRKHLFDEGDYVVLDLATLTSAP